MHVRPFSLTFAHPFSDQRLFRSPLIPSATWMDGCSKRMRYQGLGLRVSFYFRAKGGWCLSRAAFCLYLTSSGPALSSTDTVTRNHLRELVHNLRHGHTTLKVLLQPSGTECEVAACLKGLSFLPASFASPFSSAFAHEAPWECASTSCQDRLLARAPSYSSRRYSRPTRAAHTRGRNRLDRSCPRSHSSLGTLSLRLHAAHALVQSRSPRPIELAAFANSAPGSFAAHAPGAVLVPRFRGEHGRGEEEEGARCFHGPTKPEYCAQAAHNVTLLFAGAIIPLGASEAGFSLERACDVDAGVAWPRPVNSHGELMSRLVSSPPSRYRLVRCSRSQYCLQFVSVFLTSRCRTRSSLFVLFFKDHPRFSLPIFAAKTVEAICDTDSSSSPKIAYESSRRCLRRPSNSPLPVARGSYSISSVLSSNFGPRRLKAWLERCYAFLFRARYSTYAKFGHAISTFALSLQRPLHNRPACPSAFSPPGSIACMSMRACRRRGAQSTWIRSDALCPGFLLPRRQRARILHTNIHTTDGVCQQKQPDNRATGS